MRKHGAPEQGKMPALDKQKKKLLNRYILKAKEKCWKKLMDELDADIWGDAYKVPAACSKTDEKLVEVARNAFPEHPYIQWRHLRVGEIVPFSLEELIQVCTKIKM